MSLTQKDNLTDASRGTGGSHSGPILEIENLSISFFTRRAKSPP
jgi:hypothetical protein